MLSVVMILLFSYNFEFSFFMVNLAKGFSIIYIFSKAQVLILLISSKMKETISRGNREEGIDFNIVGDRNYRSSDNWIGRRDNEAPELRSDLDINVHVVLPLDEGNCVCTEQSRSRPSAWENSALWTWTTALTTWSPPHRTGYMISWTHCKINGHVGSPYPNR